MHTKIKRRKSACESSQHWYMLLLGFVLPLGFLTEISSLCISLIDDIEDRIFRDETQSIFLNHHILNLWSIMHNLTSVKQWQIFK